MGVKWERIMKLFSTLLLTVPPQFRPVLLKRGLAEVPPLFPVMREIDCHCQHFLVGFFLVLDTEGHGVEKQVTCAGLPEMVLLWLVCTVRETLFLRIWITNAAKCNVRITMDSFFFPVWFHFFKLCWFLQECPVMAGCLTSGTWSSALLSPKSSINVLMKRSDKAAQTHQIQEIQPSLIHCFIFKICFIYRVFIHSAFITVRHIGQIWTAKIK